MFGSCMSNPNPVKFIQSPLQKISLKRRAETNVMALTHIVVTYTHPIAALKQFRGPSSPSHNALSLAHIYGVKNIYSGLIRLYAAYNIHKRELYHLALMTYVGVFAFYAMEWLIWKTVRLRETASSFLISGVMLSWMLIEQDRYLV